MNIGLICNEYPPARCGGIGTFTKELAESLVSAGHRVTVIGVYDSVAREIQEVINGVDVVRMPAKKGKLALMLNSRALFERVRSLQSTLDCIEVPDFEGQSAFWGRLNVPVITRLHGTAAYFANEAGRKPSKLISWLEKRALNRADNVISVSNYVGKQTEQAFSKQLQYQTVYNGVNVCPESETKQDYAYSGKVVFTGSMMTKKGVFSLAKAWPLVQQQFANATLTLIGKDTVENGVLASEKIKALAGPDANIVFTGHISKQTLEQHLRDADVGVFPSFSESFGLAPFEAMALAVPTIYTKLSCGPELVEHEKDAVLVDPNDPASLANEICALLSDEQKRQRLGKAGRHKAEQFSVNSQLASNEAAYQQIIGGRHHG